MNESHNTRYTELAFVISDMTGSYIQNFVVLLLSEECGSLRTNYYFCSQSSVEDGDAALIQC